MFFPQIKNLDLAELSQHLLSNIKPGAASLVISDILLQVNNGQTLLVVANDNDHMNNLLQEMAYLSPDINLHAFPEWDTIPYDRVSPSQEIMATRAQSLAALAKINQQGMKQRVCFLTTYRALTQKIVSPNEFIFTQLSLRPGDEHNYSDLIVQLNELGLERVDVVREPGSYAVRGSLIDVYPFDAHDPIRIDFFDNEIEALKTFDPMTQRSIESCPSIGLGTATELSLTSKKIDHFKIKYIQNFGAKAGSDNIVCELLAGKHPHGIEHWLPLFHDKMVSLLDWFPKSTTVIFNGVPEAAINNAYDQAVDYYIQRQENLGEKTEDIASLYRPVAHESFFMGWQQLSKLVSNFQYITLLPYDADPSLDLKIKTPIFPSKSPLQSLADQIKAYEGLSILSVGSEKQFQSLIQGLSSLDVNFSLKKNIANALKLRGKSSQHVFAVISPLKYSFRCDDFQVLTYQDFFGVRAPTNKNQRKNSEISIQDINAFEAGDHLVHRDHGVGRFVSMIVLELDGQEHDCLMLEYDEGAKLYVPVENLDVLSKYAGHNSDVVLDRLGSVQWQKRVKRVKEKIFEVAGTLMETAAKRTVVQKPRFDVSLPLYHEFCAQFPYEETTDQKVAIEQVESDLGSETPMDRLICGDVGFGKTEIAMRASALTAFNGYQVLILVPTTVLAQQHEKNFQKRFADFDCCIAQLSRFVKPAEKKRTLEGLADGRVQVLVATHAALSKKISFHNLGLIVIDEEQHFGVMQKEHLKTLSPNVNILSMSATPIPRTLQMAVAGMRGLSLIASPPIDRLAVRSQVMPYDGLIVREAILREIQRGGQIYFVCPRLKDLDVMERKLKKLIPHIRLGVGHGQLSASELDGVMEDFYQGKFDVLLATNIVESGLDVPNANTLIVYRAEYFGLSQLYQLKGRIGRSKKRAYAFFMTENSTVMEKKAYKRLEVIQSLDRLGAGFSVASHDMDLRGAGNLVGKAQSGHIKEVGYELYQQYLNEAIETLKSAPAQEAKSAFLSTDQTSSPQLSLGIQVSIPEIYIPDLNLRVGIYRKLSELTNIDALAQYQEELIDRFGDLPNSLKNLIGTIHLKILAMNLHISKIEKGTKAVAVSFNSQIPDNIEKIVALVTTNPARFQLKPSGKLLFLFNENEKESILESIIRVLQDLRNICSV